MALTHWFICTAAAVLACGGAMAQERARVLSAVPVVQQVGIPQQFCEDTQVYSGARTTGTGAVVGAIVLGVVLFLRHRKKSAAQQQGYGQQGLGVQGYGHQGYGYGPGWGKRGNKHYRKQGMGRLFFSS